jgi:hypothetical protein
MSMDFSQRNTKLGLLRFLKTVSGQEFIRDILTKTLTIPNCEFENEDCTTCRHCGTHYNGLDDESISEVLIPSILRGIINLKNVHLHENE